MRKMKDSGIEWIGDIPEDWKIKKLKFIVKISDGTHDTPLYVNQSDNSYPLVTSKCIINEKIDINLAKHISKNDYDKINLRSKVEIYDVIMPMIGTVGNPALIIDDIKFAIKNVALIRINKSYYLGKLITYLLSSNIAKTQFNILDLGGVQNFISQEKLKNMIFPMCNNVNKIVDYLDKKCSAIDSTITKEKKLIEKLKEYKQSLITETVTKGLNPDVPMKDSGVEWIGDIPEHWEIKKIKYIFSTFSGTTPKSDNQKYWNGNINWITPADYKTEDKFIKSSRKFLTYLSLKNYGLQIVPSNSLIFSKRAPIGTVAINNIELTINQGCIACVPLNNNDTKFYYYLLSILTEPFNIFGAGTTFIEISLFNFGQFKLVCPPHNEQKQIADYLDKKCSKIDENISKRQTLIEKLTEYKKSLIYEVVTGKTEVRI